MGDFIFAGPAPKKLYDESQNTAFGQDQKGMADFLYFMAAQADGDPYLMEEDAEAVSRSLETCADSTWGVSHYRGDCLEKEVAKSFAIEAPQYKILPYYNPKNLMEHLAAIRNPRLIMPLWEKIKNSPMMRYVTFYHPFSLPLAEELGRFQIQNGEDIASGLSLFDEPIRLTTYSQTQHWGMMNPDVGKENALSAQSDEYAVILMDIAVSLQEYRWFRGAVGVNGNPKEEEALLRLVQNGNPYAQKKWVKTSAREGAHVHDMLEVAQTAEDREIAEMALTALLTYDAPRAKDYIFEQFFDGSFDRNLFLQRLLPLYPFLDELSARAQILYGQKEGYESRLLSAVTGWEKKTSKVTDHLFDFLQTTNDFYSWKYRGIGSHTFTTDFFRFPQQLYWVRDEIKKLLRSQPAHEPVTIVSIGGSYGPEAYSLLFFLDADFQNDPASWGNINPAERILIYSTDIDDLALAYAERGQYRKESCTEHSDIQRDDEWERWGIEARRYFDISPDLKTYRVKEEWRRQIRFEKLDVLDLDAFIQKHGRPDGVLYNMVDGHLPDEKTEHQAAFNLAAFPKYFLATVPRKEITPAVLKEKMSLQKSRDIALLFYPKD